jgi:hypothetical protein
LSNLGVLPFETTYGRSTLKAIWGPFLMPGSERSQSLGVSTINGSIRLALTNLSNSKAKPVLKLLETLLQDQLFS